MIGVVLIALSWVLLKLEKKQLTVLGFNNPSRRSAEFAVGFMLAATIVLIQLGSTAHLSNFSWQMNPATNIAIFIESLRWNINSVLFEELIFRGYLLYKGIQLLGKNRAIVLSATAFGVYHWFSYEIFGDWITMAYVFVLTGSFGYMLALAFAWSKSIFLPIALHLGWNWTTIYVFSNGPLGDQLFIPSLGEPEMLSGFEQILVSIAIPFTLPAIVIAFIYYRERKYETS